MRPKFEMPTQEPFEPVTTINGGINAVWASLIYGVLAPLFVASNWDNPEGANHAEAIAKHLFKLPDSE